MSSSAVRGMEPEDKIFAALCSIGALANVNVASALYHWNRGWGLAGDTFHVMDALTELGDDATWFRLGDRDLAVGLRRARRLREGATLMDALAELGAAFGVPARVLPMSDDPVRTRALTIFLSSLTASEMSG